jgi:DNA-binding NarL/FixJ family response regulator
VRLPPTFTDEGIRAAVHLRARTSDLAVLVLSQYVEERYAGELITTQSAALGYLLKDRGRCRRVPRRVERIGAGATVLDPEVVAQLLTRRGRDARMERLTERERSVLALIAEGKSNQAIAQTLFVTEASVEKHITSLFQKLDLEQDEHGNRRCWPPSSTGRTERTDDHHPHTPPPTTGAGGPADGSSHGPSRPVAPPGGACRSDPDDRARRRADPRRVRQLGSERSPARRAAARHLTADAAGVRTLDVDVAAADVGIVYGGDRATLEVDGAVALDSTCRTTGTGSW